jgi:hypothetical protein
MSRAFDGCGSLSWSSLITCPRDRKSFAQNDLRREIAINRGQS